MSRTYNKHHKGWYGLKTEFKSNSNKKRRAQKKFLLEKMKKVSDEEKEDVEPEDYFKYAEGEDWWCYD